MPGGPFGNERMKLLRSHPGKNAVMTDWLQIHVRRMKKQPAGLMEKAWLVLDTAIETANAGLDLTYRFVD